MKPSQIFVSHSSKDNKLINLTVLVFKDREIAPFFARRIMMGENPVEKITNAIENSLALFVLMTYNVVQDKDTRDWVVFEIAIAKSKNMPIFCWMDKRVAEEKMFPKLLENITDYDTFDSNQDEECYRVVNAMLEKVFEIKGKPQEIKELTKKDLEEGLIEMEEAKKIAVDFVQKERSPTSITVNSIEPKGDMWVVSGSIFEKFKGGGSSEKWIIEIKGKEIISYKFEPGASWVIM